jgi:hypothetical protein
MTSSVYICYGYMYRFSSIRSETVLTGLAFPNLFYIKVDYLYKSQVIFNELMIMSPLY